MTERTCETIGETMQSEPAWHGKPAVKPQAPVSRAENLQTSEQMTASCRRPSLILWVRTAVHPSSRSTLRLRFERQKNAWRRTDALGQRRDGWHTST